MNTKARKSYKVNLEVKERVTGIVIPLWGTFLVMREMDSEDIACRWLDCYCAGRSIDRESCEIISYAVELIA